MRVVEFSYNPETGRTFLKYEDGTTKQEIRPKRYFDPTIQPWHKQKEKQDEWDCDALDDYVPSPQDFVEGVVHE